MAKRSKGGGGERREQEEKREQKEQGGTREDKGKKQEKLILTSESVKFNSLLGAILSVRSSFLSLSLFPLLPPPPSLSLHVETFGKGWALGLAVGGRLHKWTKLRDSHGLLAPWEELGFVVFGFSFAVGEGRQKGGQSGGEEFLEFATSL